LQLTAATVWADEKAAAPAPPSLDQDLPAGRTP
jgi:hypothetical protein